MIKIIRYSFKNIICMYSLLIDGFKRMNPSTKENCIFSHSNFIQGRMDLVVQIKRSILSGNNSCFFVFKKN